MLLVLAGIWLTDVVFVYALMTPDMVLARTMLLVAIDIVLLLVTVIGGRIVPAFTSSALLARGRVANLRSSGWTDGIVIGAMIAIVFVDIMAPWQRIAGGIAAVAALAHAWRFIGWRSWRSLDEPLVWSLHLAYAWLPMGLAMKALQSRRRRRLGCTMVACADHWGRGRDDPRCHDARCARPHRPDAARARA